MATSKTLQDGLGLYLSGAPADGAYNADPDAAFGGFRSSVEVRRLGAIVSDPIPPVIVEAVTGSNGEGIGYIVAPSSTTLAYMAPGDTYATGTASQALNVVTGAGTTWTAAMVGSLFTFDDGTEAGIITSYTSGTVIGVSTSQTVASQGYSIALAGTAVTVADGETHLLTGYTSTKAVRVRRENIETTDILQGKMHLSLVKVFNNAIGMGNVSNAVRVAGSEKNRGTFIYNHCGAEITLIKVWQTAGSNLRISWETPGADNSIQVITDENDAPGGGGISWNTGTSSGTGLALASLASGACYGLWIQRQLAAAGTVNVADEAELHFQWVAGGVTYDEVVSGLFRIEDTTLQGYYIFTGIDADPDFSPPGVFLGATLPVDVPIAPAPAGTTIEYRGASRYRNQYGLYSQNRYLLRLRVDDAGAEVLGTITAPADVTFTDHTSERAILYGKYHPSNDVDPAETWAWYLRGDGTDPDPTVDTATTTAMAASTYAGMFKPGYTLRQVLGPYCYGSEVRALLRARRASDSEESANTTAVTLTIGTEQMAAVNAPRSFLGFAKANQDAPPVISVETVYDVTTNTHVHQYNGYTDFYVGATLVFRLVYDSTYTVNNGLWTTFGFDQTQQSGAAVIDTPVDVVSATEIYITVNGIRRMKLNLTAQTIAFTSMQQTDPHTIYTHSSDPIADMTFNTCFQVFDNATMAWTTVARLNEDGDLYHLAWHQTDTVGEFPT